MDILWHRCLDFIKIKTGKSWCVFRMTEVAWHRLVTCEQFVLECQTLVGSGCQPVIETLVNN